MDGNKGQLLEACGIPMSHWFSKRSQTRFYYSLTLRKLGFGYMKRKDESQRDWTLRAMSYLDRKTFYKDRRYIMSILEARFAVEMIEDDYCVFRLNSRGAGAFTILFQIPYLREVGKEIFRRVAGLVILAEKRS